MRVPVLLVVGILSLACLKGRDQPPEGENLSAPGVFEGSSTLKKEALRSLGRDSVVEASLLPGACDRWLVDLREGQILEVLARQAELDVALVVRSPDGVPLMRLDTPVGRSEPEHLLFIAREHGPHVLEVENISTSQEGRYRLEVRGLGPATEQQRRRAQALASLAKGHELRRNESFAEAASRYESAARSWRGSGELGREADALEWMAWSLGRLGRYEEAAEQLGRAVAGFRGEGDRRREAVAVGDLGSIFRKLGRMDEALDCYQRSLTSWRSIDSVAGQAKALSQLANLHKGRNELSAAEARYEEALGLWRRLGRQRDESITLANLAGLYIVVGQEELALDLLDRASSLLSKRDGVEDRAFLLQEMGLAHGRLGRMAEARSAYEEALVLCRESEARRSCTSALEGLARLQYENGDYDSALELFHEALAQLERERDPRREATLVQNIAWVQFRRGKPKEALHLLGRALPTLQKTGFSAGEAAALLGIAHVERERGHLQAAYLWSRRAIDALERFRAGSDRTDLRASLFARKQEYFDFAVATAMGLHRREPTAGYDSQAFLVSEGSKARRLADVLSAARQAEGEPDPAASRRLKDLQARVNAAERERLHRLATRASPRQLERAERQLRASLEALREVTARVQPADRRPTPRARSVREIQERLLDADTLLLKYELSDEHSYLWAVSTETASVFDLPPRKELEALAEDVHQLLSQSHLRGSSSRVETRSAELSRRILGPVSGLLPTKRRLLISADGALHAIPFGALPDPARSGEPLIEEHEIAYAPSASFLLWMRSARKHGRSLGRRTLAVIADPIFRQDDERLAHASTGEARTGTPERRESMILGNLALPRLAYSGKEAEAILDFVPSGQGLLLRGFDARKEPIVNGSLTKYRILHFATHGRFSPRHPELSALVLSRLDERGRPRDAVLWAHEISASRLPAELVVLSACDTALGAQIRGEGLVGLSHAFFQAGARRVLVSLWRIDDQGAVELMARFYHGMLGEGLAPVAALRRAKLALRQDPHWSRPYYWAGFVLQGEW